MVKDSPTSCLFVDDDPEFVAYVLSLSISYNLLMDISTTFQDAKLKILANSYDAYIIDLGLPDGLGVDLIPDIREKSANRSPIVVISGIYRDEKTFRTLKEKYSIDYVLDKPIYPQQIDNLLISLCQQHVDRVPGVDSEVIKDIQNEYDKDISEKFKQLAELVKNVQDNPGNAALMELHNAVHKIAGNAGSYGYPAVSLLCKELSLEIHQKLSSKTALEKDWLDGLDIFLRKVKYNFQLPSDRLQEKSSILPAEISRPTLFIINSDIKFLELIEKEKGDYALDCTVEWNPEKALTLLKSESFNPRIVVVSQTFPGSVITGFDLIEAVQQKSHSIPVIFGIILEEDNVDIRIEVIKKGIKYIFRQPISARLLLKAMFAASEIGLLRNFKVLVMDDDPDICNFISMTLSEIGIEVQGIQDPHYLYKTLEEYQPSLLFLDIKLPAYDGFSLLKTLRADITYQNLMIIVVTAYQEKDTQISAYSCNADDIIFKPLQKEILQECVLRLSRRANLLENQSGKDSTGLSSYKELLKKLDELLTTPQQLSHYLALFRIDGYSELTKTVGDSKVNELLISISNILQSIENKQLFCYMYDAATFAILFIAYDVYLCEREVLSLLDIIQQKSSFNINFSSCIVPISKNFSNYFDIIKIIEETLKEAFQQKTGPVKLVVYSSKD